jgi:hypothetical protein
VGRDSSRADPPLVSLTIARWQAYAPYKVSMGEPNPHLTIVARAARDWYPDEPMTRAWMVGCWNGPYVATTGMHIFQHFPDFRNLVGLEAWLEQHWAGLPVRGAERRGLMAPAKMAAFLQSYARWLRMPKAGTEGAEASYDELYASARKHLKFAGRFTVIKLLEALRLAQVIGVGLPYGIQPVGAWSPRRALDELLADYGVETDLEHGNTKEKLDEVNRAAVWAGSLLGDLEPRPWLLEGLLCGARLINGSGYPGRAYDDDMEYTARATAYWHDDDSWFWEYRRQLFPEWILGELNGWHGIRPSEIERWKGII